MKSTDSIFTKAVHAGFDKKLHHGAASVPVYNASLYAFEDADEGAAVHNYMTPGYFYGRLGNPTQEALENATAELENGDAALAMASGMAATSSAVLSIVETGGHIVALTSMYSTTSSLFSYMAEHFGVEVTYVDASETANYEAAIRENSRILWLESPSNPRLNITDLEAVAALAKKHGVITIADNTFATPFNQNPLNFGVDLVIHSATKYLGGHSDLTAGVIVGSRDRVAAVRDSTNKYFGGNIAPQTAWLVLRGVKTLALRMERHNSNALEIAKWLRDQPKVKQVFYPGLEDHWNHAVAAKQMRGFGGMISFDMGGSEEAKKFINSLELVSIATSLGGVESIIQHSASMTHATLSAEERMLAGISDGLLRFSVGIEEKGDLIADIENALNSV